MNWTVLTLFPGAFEGGVLAQSILGRAIVAGLVGVRAVNIRDFADPPHFVCDDTPYGGGPGMVMKPEPIVRAFRASAEGRADAVIALSASGELLTDRIARELAGRRHVCVLCGHYEGIDQRAIEVLNAREMSIGNFLLSGGETAALALIDAVSRYVPGVLGREASHEEESFTLPAGLVEYPHYTRPADFEGREAPEILRSGNHEAVRRWRARQSLIRTAQRRPDLIREEQILQSKWADEYKELKKDGGRNG